MIYMHVDTYMLLCNVDNALDLCRHTAISHYQLYNPTQLFSVSYIYASSFLACKMNAKMLGGVDYS